MLRPSQRHFATENLDPRLRAGLVGHWIGGGSGLTWFDRSGFGNHGALQGGASWTLSKDSHRAAVSLDGNNDTVNLGSCSVLDGQAQITIAGWSRLFAPVNGTLWGKYQSSSVWITVLFSGGSMYFIPSDLANRVTMTQPADTHWHHYAAVFNGTLSGNAERAKIYLDGRIQSPAYSGIIGATTASPVASAHIGYDGFNNLYYSGVHEDVRVYSRALSAAEVSLLANPAFLPVVPRRWSPPRAPLNFRRSISISGSRASYSLQGSPSSYSIAGSRSSYLIEGS